MMGLSRNKAGEESAVHSIVTYSALKSRVTIGSSLAQAGREIWATREVIWRLFVRDFTQQFRQKLLGYLWMVIGPMVNAAGFVFLFSAGILKPGEMVIPYPVFVLFGTYLWGMMTGVFAVVSGSLRAQGELIMRTNIPKIALALTGMGNFAFGLATNLVVLLGIMICIGISPSWLVVTFPLLIVPLIALGVGMGLILAVIGVMARDLTTLATTALNLLMLVTPVVYVGKVDLPVLQRMMEYNPLTYLIDGPRTLVMTGTVSHPLAYAVASVLAIAMLMLGVYAFYLIQDKVAERL
jgi:ABC-type polysaccharide/polyol phosphate export permease